ncbi:MAG: alpha/beta hydrolase [Candidatus Korobacteraceae bacterium]
MNLLRTGVRIMLTFLVGVYVLLIALAMFSDRLIFQPHPAGYDLETLARAAPGVQTFRIPCECGGIAAAYLPNPEAQYTLLYSHGNGEDMGDDLPILEDYRRAGFAVFAYDYNGYGASGGRPSEAAVYRDVEAAFDYLTGTLHVPPERVIVFGHSLGAAAAIHLAAIRPVAGLIAQAPFLSAFRVVTRIQIVPWDKFNNARTIGRVHCPVLVAQGRNDEVIPFWHGERIYGLANPPKEHIWLDGAGHNDVMLVASRPYLAAIQNFAARLSEGN